MEQEMFNFNSNKLTKVDKSIFTGVFNDKNIEIIVINGEPLFNAKDIGRCLEMEDSTTRWHVVNMPKEQVVKITNELVLADVGLTNIRKFNHAGESFLTESGVYKLVIKSRKPEAVEFQDWICNEVLPSIRKTGQYKVAQQETSQQSYLSLDKIAQDKISATLAIADMFGCPKHIAIQTANDMVKKQIGLDYTPLVKASRYMLNISEEEIMCEPTELGKTINKSGRTINSLLAKAGLQKKENSQWIPTQDGEPYCTKHCWTKSNKSGYNLKWYKVRTINLLKEKNII